MKIQNGEIWDGSRKIGTVKTVIVATVGSKSKQFEVGLGAMAQIADFARDCQCGPEEESIRIDPS